MTDPAMVAQLEQAAAELDAAAHSARRELLVAALPFGMTLVGFLAVRKQRRIVKGQLQRLEWAAAGQAENEPVCGIPDEFPEDAEGDIVDE